MKKKEGFKKGIIKHKTSNAFSRNKAKVVASQFLSHRSAVKWGKRRKVKRLNYFGQA